LFLISLYQIHEMQQHSIEQEGQQQSILAENVRVTAIKDALEVEVRRSAPL
jgi:hypothetical protein